MITAIPFPWMFFGPRPAGEDAFSPASLFAGGEDGAWYDPSDLATVWADTAGTTPASVDGAVARIDDKSGSALHLTNATAGRRPLLKTAGGLYWLEFDGSDDSLWSAGNLTLASEQAIVCYGAQRTEVAQYVVVAAAPDNGGFLCSETFNADGDVSGELISDNGPITAAITDATFGTDVHVTTVTLDRADPDAGRVAMRVNGASQAVSADDGGGTCVGNFASQPLHMGATSGPAFMLAGKIFGLVIRAGTLAAGELSDLETWMQAKSGATF